MRPAVHAVLVPRRHPEPRRTRDARARSTRAASSATPCRTPTAPRSTTRTSWSRRSSATARPRPARWRPAGTRNKFVDPRRDGAVLPILHLNGYKIANPTVLARIPEEELRLAAARLRPHAVRRRRATTRTTMHQAFAATLDHCLDEIRDIQQRGPRPRGGSRSRAAPWPMIVLRSPKGWTGPKEVDGRTRRGLLALPPGAVRRRPRQRRPPGGARGVDAQLPARGAVRRRPARPVAGDPPTCTPPGTGG